MLGGGGYRELSGTTERGNSDALARNWSIQGLGRGPGPRGARLLVGRSLMTGIIDFNCVFPDAMITASHNPDNCIKLEAA